MLQVRYPCFLFYCLSLDAASMRQAFVSFGFLHHTPPRLQPEQALNQPGLDLRNELNFSNLFLAEFLHFSFNEY